MVTVTMIDGLTILSATLGWIYFFAWSFSFYPQAILNYRRQFVGGLSIDFGLLNFLGHTSYAIYNSAFYWNDSIREEYRRSHRGHDNSVAPNDVAFSIHASVLAAIIALQTIIYPREPGQRLSTYNKVAIAIFSVILIGHVIAAMLRREHAIEILYVFAAFKLYVSVAKYWAQATLNYKRQSTVGWSITNVVLDFTGSILALIQLLLDSARMNDWSAVTGNPAKFGLSLLVIGFGVLYLLQHFVLYRDHTDEHLKASQGDQGPPSLVVTSPTFDEETGLGVENQGHRQDERAPLLQSSPKRK